MNAAPLLSVVIVNYNGGGLLQRTLQSLYDTAGGLAPEVFVVDNGSSDGSLGPVRRHFPAIRVIENGANLGFARASNQALRQSLGRYVLLLNPDVELQDGAVKTVVSYLESNPGIGIVGPKVLLPNGRLDKPCRRSFKTPAIYFYKCVGLSALFPRSPRFNRYYLGYLPEDQVADVDAVIGAFLAIRRESMEEIGLLDERFFMYCEDEDWCFRAKQTGWRVIYNPAAIVIHHKGSSTRKRPLRMVYEWHKAILQFHRKNMAPDYSPAVNGLVYLGVGLRLAAAMTASALRGIVQRG